MRTRMVTWMALLGWIGTLLAACGPQPTPTALPTTVPTPAIVPTAPPEALSLLSYTHPAGLFTLSYPQGWTVEEEAEQISFLSPDRVFHIFLQFTDIGQTLDEEGMGSLIDGFFESFSQDLADFQRQEETPQPDGSILVDYSFTLEGRPGYGASFFEQHGTMVYVLSFWTQDADRWEEILPTFDAVANSFAPQKAPEELTAGWSVLTSEAGGYTIAYPPDWEAQEVDGNAFIQKDEETFLIIVMTTTLPAADPDQAERAFIDETVDSIRNDDPNAEISAPDTLFFGGEEAVFIDFTYVDPQTNLENKGTALAVAHGGRLYQVILFSLTRDAEVNLPLFTQMLLSFRFTR
ncbi:MAG: hypothetical protein ACP5OO_13405 [Chloroflexia bacterium]